MLSICLPTVNLWDEEREEFIYIEGRTISLEHSLVSLSKWESKWKKPFLTQDKKSDEETIDYIKCMTVSKNVPDELYSGLTQSDVDRILSYIDDSMTATTFTKHSNSPRSGKRQQILTNEVIYYLMISYNIPVEFEKWHLNRLITLIRVCQDKNEPPKKMSKSAAMARNKSLNASRKQAMHSHG